MKSSLLIAFFFLFATSPVHAQFPTPLPREPQQTICAGNTPPEGMIITETGNSPICGGSCRSRQIERVHGGIMVICAQQPLPHNYEIQSVTSNPACSCLGDEDNAYVIRAKNGTLPTPTPLPQLGPQMFPPPQQQQQPSEPPPFTP
jgi:hypothetical protein